MANLSPKVKSLVYANLDKYARSGIGMEKACESMLSQPGVGSAERKIYQGTLDGIKQGWSIGQSMGNTQGVVSEMEQEIVTASEAGGMLEKGFAHLAEYYRRVDRTRRKVRRGMAYPLVLIHAAIPLTIFMGAIFGQMNPDSEGVGFGAALLSSLAQAGMWILAGYIGVLVIFGFVVFLFKRAKTSAVVDQFLNYLPLIGKARRFVALERFCQVFEIFLLSGLKMSDSLIGAGKASGSGLIRLASENGAQKITESSSLAETIFASPRAFPNDFARGIATAEESGHLDTELGQWGRYYSESAGEAMEQVAVWAPKLFYWLVLVLVGFMIIRAGMAYMNVFQNLSEYEF